MGWTDAFTKALQFGLGPVLGVGAGFATGNPLLGIGLGLGGLGASMTAAGTRARQTGPSDEEIEGAIAAERRARSTQIQQMEERAARGVASRAAQGGVLESGLTSRSMGDVSTAANAQRDALTAQLAQARIQGHGMQGYQPELTGWGTAGTLMAQMASPLAMIGSAQLMRDAFPNGPPTSDLLGGRGGASEVGRVTRSYDALSDPATAVTQYGGAQPVAQTQQALQPVAAQRTLSLGLPQPMRPEFGSFAALQPGADVYGRGSAMTDLWFNPYLVTQGATTRW